MTRSQDWVKEVGIKLKVAREKAGLSRQEVASFLGLTVEGYGHFERGKRLIGMEHMIRLPAFLGVPITDLLPDSVVTDYDRARAADPRLQEIAQAWPELPEFLRDGLTSMVRDARKQFGKK